MISFQRKFEISFTVTMFITSEGLKWLYGSVSYFRPSWPGRVKYFKNDRSRYEKHAKVPYSIEHTIDYYTATIFVRIFLIFISTSYLQVWIRYVIPKPILCADFLFNDDTAMPYLWVIIVLFYQYLIFQNIKEIIKIHHSKIQCQWLSSRFVYMLSFRGEFLRRNG